MKDLNFFSSYSKKNNKKSFDKSIILYSFVILILIGVLSYGLYNFISIKKLNHDIEALKIEAEAKNQGAKIKVTLKKQQEINAYKESISKLSVLDKYVRDRDVVNEILLGDIGVNIPADLFLDSMVISQDNIRIEGKSKDKESIAQFQHNLKGIERFEQVFVPQMLDIDGNYSFYLDIKFKEEKPDGSEASK
ncbi:PilN domain-containing protein [Lutispora saccharofermentans]|uniref:PilN domain-containing protein n=1 Tax=Lutispora saccharofermentans TaxID=3024236 RepID=A0ABT1NEY9_9FIRM|nr:PilN domain-containing protein [Lutispora saccharofermentans]MCQ1529807.1 PilN domain-containing protein [Lutispora saccharofermentans]